MRYILDLTRPYDNLLMTEGAQNQSFVWGNELLSASGNESFHYLNDHLGSPIRLMGESETDALAYDEFGVALVGADKNLNQPFGFTGYQTGEVSGLYYAQARYFEPATSRFISEDYVRDGVNWYVHCYNNPLIFVDLDGLAPTALEAAHMANNAYKSRKEKENSSPGDWSYEDTITGGTGMSMDVYSRRNSDGKEYTVASKGSSTWQDWVNNAAQPTGLSPDMRAAIAAAERFVNSMPDGTEITFTGHSKGGAEAAANALATGMDAIIFNSAFPNLSAYGLGDAMKGYEGTITHYVIAGEALTLFYLALKTKNPLLARFLLDNPAVITIMLSPENLLTIFQNHDMDAIIAALMQLEDCPE